MIHTIKIPNWHPVLLNRLLNAHWAEAARLKAEDRQFVSVYAAAQHVPKVKILRSAKARKTASGKPSPGRILKGTGPRRRVSLMLYLEPGQRRGDRDGYWKSVLDALVRCERLVNDSPTWSEQGSVEFERGDKKATIITLEDVE